MVPDAQKGILAYPRRCPLSLVFLLLASMPHPPAGIQAQSTSRSSPGEPKPQVAIPHGVERLPDITYALRGERHLKLDLYRPAFGVGPFPGVVLIHGETPADRGKGHYDGLASHLAARGFVTASIEYRGAREAPYPGAIEDAKEAVRWLREQAAEYRLDPTAIGVVGENFGGYLAAMLGVVSGIGEEGLTEPRSELKPTVQAVLAIHPMVDLPAYNAYVEFPWYLQVFLGYPYVQNPQLWLDASPITYVNSRSAPFLMAHGAEDVKVPLQQSLDLRDALMAVGVDGEVYSPEGAGNGSFVQGDPRLQAGAVEFFRENLTIPPPGVRMFEDLVYASPNERDLRLDLFVPELNAGPLPAVIFIHGGGWAFGGKRDWRYAAAQLASSGFVTATIEYRLSSERIYPAAIDDAKAAVEWMRSNADLFGVNAQQIGVVGSSAGGHIASLLGVTGDRNHMSQGDDDPVQSARVQAVAAVSGAYDMFEADRRDNWAPAAFMGGLPQQSPGLWEAASPIKHVGPGSAPHLFLHGTLDELTPGSEAERMMQKLLEAGVHAEMFSAEGGDHDFFATWQWEQRVLEALEDFFQRMLR